MDPELQKPKRLYGYREEHICLRKHKWGIIWATPSENVPSVHALPVKSQMHSRSPLHEWLDTIDSVNGEQKPSWDLAHVQDDVNPHILRMLEGTFSLGVVHNIQSVLEVPN